jgi:hypothetical protein
MLWESKDKYVTGFSGSAASGGPKNDREQERRTRMIENKVGEE